MRPNWDQYFISMAHLAAIRSPDSQTQVGCVIVDSDNHIIGIGYNGFPANTQSDELPTVRPEKYPFMIHAEQNALSNTIILSKNLKAYVTAYPCVTCSKLLWQRGVREIIVDKNGVVYSMTSDDLKVMQFLMNNGLIFREIGVNHDIFLNIYKKLEGRNK